MPGKLGKSAADLFRKTETRKPVEQPAAAPKGSEEPKTDRREAAAANEQATAKVTFLLTPSQTTFLDELCLAVKKQSGRGMRRTEVVRALIDVLRRLDINLDGVDSEEQLRERILERFP